MGPLVIAVLLSLSACAPWIATKAAKTTVKAGAFAAKTTVKTGAAAVRVTGRGIGAAARAAR
jgi:hypothetical protein